MTPIHFWLAPCLSFSRLRPCISHHPRFASYCMHTTPIHFWLAPCLSFSRLRPCISQLHSPSFQCPLAQAALVVGDCDLVLFLGGFVDSRYIQNAICINIKRNHNLWYSTRCRRN